MWQVYRSIYIQYIDLQLYNMNGTSKTIFMDEMCNKLFTQT